ncbi:MAG: hypothetical protein ACE5GX_08580 [Thermoanaerobaculia bacterium]
MAGLTRRQSVQLWLGLIVWLLAFGMSIVLAAISDPVGDGFTRGINRIGTFFRWQFLAFAAAIYVWLFGRGLADPPRHLQLTTRVPIYVQCLLGLVGVAVVAAAVIFK